MSENKSRGRFKRWFLRFVGVCLVGLFALYLAMRWHKDREPDVGYAKDYKAPSYRPVKPPKTPPKPVKRIPPTTQATTRATTQATTRASSQPAARVAQAPKPLPQPFKGRCGTSAAGEKNLYWGDLHVHTSYSMDAYNLGTRNGPRDAYAFAQGQALTLSDNKTKIRIDRKLDFMAVTDHAEFFGVTTVCFDPRYRNSWFCLLYRNGSRFERTARLIAAGIVGSDNALSPKPKVPPICRRKDVDCVEAMRNTWKHIQAAAQQAYKPCRFTSFIGYEWTATPRGKHMHRNIIFANAQVPTDAYGYLRYPSTTALWKALQRGCDKKRGCDVIAIPHNSNWSDGRAFRIENASQQELALRARYERLVEIHQIKGSSECLHPFGDDKGDCNFEIAINPMSEAFMKGAWFGLRRLKMTRKRWNTLRKSYVRAALRRGLRFYARSADRKQNPLKLGFIASTDTHNATPGAVGQTLYRGSHGDLDITARRALHARYLSMNPGGLVAVWAHENTRESIFAALKRRETYGTSGPRMRVRFFQSWRKGGDPCQAGQRFADGIPMGGDVAKPPADGAKPRFVVNALMDKARLARIDLYKATFVDGKVHERLYSFNARDKAKGDASMCRSWMDKEFAPNAPTLWYARVLEVPTKRWSTRVCEAAKLCKDFPNAKRMVQQRAWTSPIWYLP